MGEGGELPARMKELIALAIAVTRECDGCIAAHARGAARLAASEQEVAEALGVAYKTVANTLSRIKDKLGVSQTADLIRIAIGQGLA